MGPSKAQSSSLD